MTVFEALSELEPYTFFITLEVLDKDLGVGDTDIRTSLGKSPAETDSELVQSAL